jgi:tripartite-type tricarboxylate transporter receptor subunit TctC
MVKRYLVALRAALVGVTLCAGAGAAFADAYPSKPIRLIVPFAAGGFTDQAARAMAKALSDDLKQPVIVDNRGGGGGRIGTEALARMAPDGYNLLLTNNGSLTYMAVTEKTLSYDPIKDFTPISELASFGLLLVVHPSVPAKNVADFIAYAKQNPGKLSFASSGPGSGLHFAGEMFKSMAGIEMTHVPYRGSGPGLLDVVANVCQVIFSGDAKPQVDAGKVRVLGTTSTVRDARLPDVPTIAEAGLPGYDMAAWIALLGPAGLPAEVRSRLATAVKNSLADEALKKQFAGMGMATVGSSPEKLVELIRKETAKLKTVAASSGIVP